MEEGKRLENLSWRLWNRETFCCESKPKFPDTPTSQAPTPRPQSKKSVPELSASVESLASATDEYDHTPHHGEHSPSVHIQGLSSEKSSLESLSSGRWKAKPISSQALERMVFSIKDTKITQKDDMTCLPASITEALPTPSIKLAPPPFQSRPEKTEPQEALPQRPSHQRISQSSTSTAPMSSPGSGVVRSQTLGSDTSAELITPHSIVRGFGPNRISSMQRTSSNVTTTHSPVPIKSVLRTRMDASSSKEANFMLGGSSDDESSFDDQKSFRTSQSSLTAALKNPQPPSSHKKMTSFKEEVESRTIADRSAADEAAIDTDEEDDDEEGEDDDDDDISESAIEEEEDSDWEDSATDSGAASPAEKPLFQRVDSKPNLASRRSLITTMVHQSDRAAALANEASKSQPTVGRSRALSRAQKEDASDDDDDERVSRKANQSNIPRSKPISMATPSSSSHNALSPRTTRRNMLATELTESLRKHLLWERQQKNTTANAVLKRRHTAHDMANLQKYPENGNGSGSASKNNSWNNHFDHGLGEYNSRGW
ncbi:hypothetical protein MMC10_004736 [Thelotrema lepadinum]|nr:hypothetical protein [Thelotrema lepadinum]